MTHSAHEGSTGDGWAGEADRIVEGVQRWLTEAAQGAHGGLDTGSPTCGVCPVCRAVGAVRTADPALLAAGLEVATSAALSIADALKRAADDLLDLVTGQVPNASTATTVDDQVPTASERRPPRRGCGGSRRAVTLSIGVDIGGTKTAVGLVAADGSILRSMVVPTPAQDSEELFTATAACIREVAGDEKPIGVGVGVAGLVDAAGSTVVFAPHLAWRGTDVAGRLAEITGLPVEVDNDVAATAWAEYTFGAGRGADPLVVVAVGTGLGGGIVIGGELMRGATGASGEVGHVPFVPDGHQCACGARGCWEQYASGSALTRAARELVASGSSEAAALRDSCGGDPQALKGQAVTELALAGDAASLRIIADVGTALGVGLSGIVAVLDPARVVVGGGVAAAGDLLLEPARAAMAGRLVGAAYREIPPIVPAACGESAAMIGAAELARRRFDRP